MENPSNSQDLTHASFLSNKFVGGNVSNTNSALAPGSSWPGLGHNPGISLNWSPEEQAILEDGLHRYASETKIDQFSKIALQLQNKTVREVALRCRWMIEKENSRRRTAGRNLTRKSKEKKAGPNVHPYVLTKNRTYNDDEISCKVLGGAIGELLEQTAESLNQISSNLVEMKLQENINLFHQSQDNILKLMNDLNQVMPDIMKRMLPLPVKLNEELANTILRPQTDVPCHFYPSGKAEYFYPSGEVEVKTN